ncbi:hypothetical protein [Ruegeria denitrificans]|uniref:hypothetical protein n=1 Tax=Ruegeria denitrificans TaxID=1715692 RepID=UPI003C79F5AF
MTWSFDFLEEAISWVKAHRLWSVVAALGIAGISIFLKTLVSRAADDFYEARKLGRQERRHQNRNGAKGQRPANENKTTELSSSELLKFYSEERPIVISISDKEWSFPASIEIMPEGDGRVGHQNLEFSYRDHLFELDPPLESATQPYYRKLLEQKDQLGLFNGQPFRLASLETNGRKTRIQVERCWYFDSLRTNFSMDQVLPDHGISLREYIHGKTRKFESFSSSRLPNHMGLVVIIETLDGQLLTQKRSRRVAVRGGTLSSSVSGTFEKSDLEYPGKDISLEDALRAVYREMHAEMGGRFGGREQELVFLGLVREFRRGGFPDFYFYWRSDRALEQLKLDAQDAEERGEIDEFVGLPFNTDAFLHDKEKERSAFEKRVNNILSSTEPKANLTLRLGVALTYQHFVERA